MSDFQDVCGLWVNEGKKGKYLSSGKLQEEVTIPAGSKIWIFPNKHRKKETHPTHSMSFSPPEEYQAPAQEKFDDDFPAF